MVNIVHISELQYKHDPQKEQTKYLICQIQYMHVCHSHVDINDAHIAFTTVSAHEKSTVLNIYMRILVLVNVCLFRGEQPEKVSTRATLIEKKRKHETYN